MDQRMSESVPLAMLPVFDAVVARTDAFCREHLDEESGLLWTFAAHHGKSRKRHFVLV